MLGIEAVKIYPRLHHSIYQVLFLANHLEVLFILAQVQVNVNFVIIPFSDGKNWISLTISLLPLRNKPTVTDCFARRKVHRYQSINLIP